MTTTTNNKREKEWDRETAQEVFDVLTEFFTIAKIKDIPMSILEAVDYVGNYVGDIAKGRKITLDKPQDAFPSLFSSERQRMREEIIKEFIEGKRCLTCGELRGKGGKLSDTCLKCLEE